MAGGVNLRLAFSKKSSHLVLRSKDKTDLDVFREQNKFIWDDSEDLSDLSWEKRLAKRYYDKLFKEYCICDLTYFEQNKVS